MSTVSSERRRTDRSKPRAWDGRDFLRKKSSKASLAASLQCFPAFVRIFQACRQERHFPSGSISCFFPARLGLVSQRGCQRQVAPQPQRIAFWAVMDVEFYSSGFVRKWASAKFVESMSMIYDSDSTRLMRLLPMTIFQSIMQRFQSGFSAPRRRAAAGRRSLITAGLECLEDRRVMSADGWLPGFNFEMESNDTRALADPIAVTSIAAPNADVVFTGAIRRTDDVDYYKFTLHKTSAVQLDVYKLNPSLQMSGDVDLILEDSSGQQLAISNRRGGNSERINQELSAGTYFIKVYPFGATGFGVSYQVRLQSTASSTPDPPVVPGTSIVTGPSNTNDSTPTFMWTTASNATHYELWVSNKTTRQIVIHERNLTETSFTRDSELPAGSYTVWVRACNGDVPGRWSPGHVFSVTKVQPGTSTVTGPSNTNDSTPTFTWTSASNATRYELWVNNKTTRQRVIHEANLSENSYTPDSEMADGTYTVWVRAWNGNVSGSWSLGHTFLLANEGPGTSIVTGPSNSSDSTPTFIWTSASNATRYELWVNNQTTRQRVIHEMNVTDTSFTPGSEMPAGAYSVWVRAWNGNTPGAWSERRDFTLTASAVDDPNGRNNSWQEATPLRNLDDGTTSGVKQDRLSATDNTDHFLITWGRNRTHVGLRVTISVTEGNFSDLRIKVYRLRDGRLSEMGSLTASRSGDSLTLSTNPMIVSSMDTGFIIQVTSATGSENLAYRIEA